MTTTALDHLIRGRGLFIFFNSNKGNHVYQT